MPATTGAEQVEQTATAYLAAVDAHRLAAERSARLAAEAREAQAAEILAFLEMEKARWAYNGKVRRVAGVA